MKEFTPNTHQQKLEETAELMYYQTESGQHYGGCIVRACIYANNKTDVILIPGNCREIGRFLANHASDTNIIRISFRDNEPICELRSGALTTYGNNKTANEIKGQFARFSIARDDSYMQTYTYDNIPEILTNWWNNGWIKKIDGQLYDLASELLNH